MIDCRFVPVAEWPGKKTDSYRREKSRFDTAYTKTLDLLERELNFLGAKDILVQAFFRREDIRNDGWPKSNARPAEPGVIISFINRSKKTISMPCDRFKDWESNLRAITLSLESLRRVDRYGVTQGGEQYRGWEQLPPAPPQVKEMTVDLASIIISNYCPRHSANDVLMRKDYCEAAIREALLKAHPDKGGTHETYLMVYQAIKLLRARHG